MFSGGRLFSFQTASCRHSATGGSLGRGGRASDTRQVELLPAYLLLPAVSSEWQALCQMWPAAPQRDRIWIPCQTCLVKGCKYSSDVPSIDSFPDPSYHGQWRVSKRMTRFLWLTEAEQVGREIEKTGGGMFRAWGETLWTSDLVKRGLQYANS